MGGCRWEEDEERHLAGRERGSSSLEFVGVLPALIVAALVSAQLLAAGFSLWSASVAARAGARAVHIGSDPTAAARGALPSPLRGASEVRQQRAGVVAARVPVPRLLPLMPSLKVEARSGLEAGG